MEGLGPDAGTDLAVWGWYLRYYPSGAVLDPSAATNAPSEIDDRYARDHTRLRRIQMQLKKGAERQPATALLYYLLHWSDGTDLDELDEMVRAGLAEESLFTECLVGEFQNHVCRGCGRRYRVVAADPAAPIPPGDQAVALRRHTYHARCPGCGEPTRRVILEFVRELSGRAESP